MGVEEFSERLVDSVSPKIERRISRRNLLTKLTKAGTILSLTPVAYVMRPTPAAADISPDGIDPSDYFGDVPGTGDIDDLAEDGNTLIAGTKPGDCSGQTCSTDPNTAFCCGLTGRNYCPSGTHKSGWWKCSYAGCASGTRYFIDCNVGPASSCTCHCANQKCSHRKVCCNSREWFNCNSYLTLGRIKCRIVRCKNPGNIWAECSKSGVVSNTCGDTAGCLP